MLVELAMELPGQLEEETWLGFGCWLTKIGWNKPELALKGSGHVKSTKISPQTNLSVLVATLVLELATEQGKQAHTTGTATDHNQLNRFELCVWVFNLPNRGQAVPRCECALARSNFLCLLFGHRPLTHL